MDISHIASGIKTKIKKYISSRSFTASFALIALLTSVAGPSAQAFTDVPQDAYYKASIDWAIQNGVVEDGRSYRPAAILTRQDLAQMLALNFKYPLNSAINPLYKDILNTSSYYKYVAAVSNAGVMSGYTDASGNLSGYFGPKDGTTRAAVAKVLTRGFGLEDSECRTRFPDVKYSEWYGPYIDTMCAYGIMRGDGQGKARPSDLINRAEFITMLHRASLLKPVTDPTPINELPDNEDEPAPVVIPEVGGTLKVELASTTPPATSIPSDASSITYTRLALSATNEDVAVSSMNIWRAGLGSKADFENVWLAVNGFNIGSERNINSDGYAQMNLSRDQIIVPKGQTVIVDVKATMADNVGANLQNKLGIKSASDIESNATKIQGTFPLYGNSMSTSSFTAGSVNFIRDGTASKISVGASQAILGEFRIDNRSTTQDVRLAQLELEINGTGSYKNLANVQIYYGGNAVSNKVTPTKDMLQFIFNDNGYIIKKGNSARFDIKADIVFGREADTLQFKLDRANDLLVRPINSNSYAIKVNRVNPSTGLLSVHTIDAGTVTFARHNSSPASTNVSKDTTKATFLVTQITAGDSVELRNMRVYLDANLKTSTNGVTPITADECSSPSSLTSILNAKIQNVKLWNGTKLAAGGQNNVTSVTAGTFASGTCSIRDAYYSFNDQFVLNKGVNLVSITADIRRYTTNGEQFSLSLDNSPSTWATGAYLSSNKALASTNINGSSSGSMFTITDAGLTLSRQDGFGDNEDIVRGAQDSVLLTFKLENNNVSDVIISDLTIQDSDGISNGAANDVNGTLLTGFGIYESGTDRLLARSVQDLGSDDIARFDGLSISIPSGGFKLFDVRGSISGSWDSANGLQLYLTQIIGKDSRNNDAIVTYPSCINSCSSNNALAFANFDVNDTANVTVSFASRSDSNYGRLQSPTGPCIIASCAKVVGQFKLKPLYDDVILKKLVLNNDDDAQNFSQRFGTFFLVDERTGDVVDTGTLSDAGGLADGRVTFDGFNFVLKKEVESRLNVLSEIHNITRAEHTGGFIKLSLGGTTSTDLRLISAATGSDVATSAISNNALSSSELVQTHVARRTFPTISYLNSSIAKNITGNMIGTSIYKFSINADAKGDVEWTRLTFDTTETDDIDATNFKLFVEGQAQAIPASITTNAGRVIIDTTTRQNITAGKSTTYILKADVAITNSAVSQTLSVSLTAADDTSLTTNSLSNLSTANFLWSDKSAQSHSATSLDWTNGYEVDAFDVNSVNISYKN